MIALGLAVHGVRASSRMRMAGFLRMARAIATAAAGPGERDAALADQGVVAS